MTQISQSKKGQVPGQALRVAWFSYFPIEWQPNLPPELQNLPKLHPASWQTVLLNEFEDRPGLDLHVLVLRKDFARNLTLVRKNITIHCLKTPGGLRAPSLYWLDTFLIHRALRKIKPDLVHAWGSEFGAASVATRLPYPSLITMQGLLTWIKTVSPLNRHQKISAWLEERALKKARFVTAESSFSMAYLKARYPQLSLSQIEHAPNPIFSRVERSPVTNILRLVCVSSFSYAKGADVLLEALASLDPKIDFELSWIGGKDSSYEAALHQKVPARIWEKIVFKNNLQPSQIAAELSTATLMVYPTRADNSPNAVKEAAVAGVPVVASRVGGIPDYVQSGANGELFEVGNIRACADAIQRALKNPMFNKGLVDPKTLDRMREYLSAKTMAEKFARTYVDVVQISTSKP